MSCASNPALPNIPPLEWPQISLVYEELLTAAGDEIYKAAYRYELALAIWAYDYDQGKRREFPKLPEALAEMLKKGSDDLKREAIKHQLEWLTWAKKMGVIKP